jgi:hypothetical protein
MISDRAQVYWTATSSGVGAALDARRLAMESRSTPVMAGLL